MSQLPDAEKLRRLLTLASLRIKPLGRSSIEVIDGIRMSVQMVGRGCVALKITRKYREDTLAIQERLRSAGYNAKLGRQGSRFAVYISHGEIKKHPELVVKVCEVLRKMLNEAISEGKTKRASAITKAMENLGCQ